MKKLLLSITAVLAVGFINAQLYVADDSTAFAAWTVYDNDGDGNNWTASNINNPTLTAPGFDGSSGFLSASWSGAALTPDNLAISPVTDCSGSSTVFVNWSAGSPETTTSGWYEEHYAVYVVRASDLPAILTGSYPAPVHETTLAAGELFIPESIDVTSIAAGHSDVHVIIRHFMCTDENWMFLTALTLTSDQPVGLEELSAKAKVYPNPTNSILNVQTNVAANSIAIISMDGKVVSTTAISGLNGSVDVSNLTEGVYFYEVSVADGSVIRNTFVKK